MREPLKALIAQMRWSGMERVLDEELDLAERQGTPVPEVLFRLLSAEDAARLQQITRDHSLLQEQIDAGLITQEQAAFSANKNLVTRAVGVEDTVMLETHQHDVLPGDLYLMCSDGLSDMLDDAAIAQLLSTTESLEGGCRALIEAANDAGGKDNISVILVRAAGGTSTSARSWWPFRR